MLSAYFITIDTAIPLSKTIRDQTTQIKYIFVSVQWRGTDERERERERVVEIEITVNKIEIKTMSCSWHLALLRFAYSRFHQ